VACYSPIQAYRNPFDHEGPLLFSPPHSGFSDSANIAWAMRCHQDDNQYNDHKGFLNQIKQYLQNLKNQSEEGKIREDLHGRRDYDRLELGVIVLSL
jgi:hypothetical protein